ncbi:dienelactone hydrolase family protein [Hydrogenophaga sp. BPS33]|uniref:dienelactone hydrolase family protein n=1 Tax=Hydrogenophaga sp. BPS33 TaxID=2651974 RepID=UPI00135746FA|nr:dienelactone hydrolase family protein [Hydrogenophaga sp. BPS33]
MGQFIDVPSRDGQTFQAWFETPDASTGAARPALVFLAEAYNLNDWARAEAARYAAQGYTVLAPDLYWRIQPHQYMPYSSESQARARSIYAQLDYDAAVDDCGACIDFLRQRPDANGKVGVVGFCIGGKLALLSGARESADAVAGFYSIDLEAHFVEVPRIACPALFHFGETDARVPVAYADEIRAHSRAGQDVGVPVYAQAGHAFCRYGQPPYHEAAATLATQRTWDLFARALHTTATAKPPVRTTA